jgi:hypothetical protein
MLKLSIEQDQMMMTIKKDDLKLKKAIDEGRYLLDQLSSFQKEKVDSLVGIKNLWNRVGEVCKFKMYAKYICLQLSFS